MAANAGAMELDDAARAAPPPSAKRCDCVIIIAAVIFAGVMLPVLWFAASRTWAIATYEGPHYSVAIAAVSGLDPAADLGHRPALDPEFNLTVRIALRSKLLRRCDKPFTTGGGGLPRLRARLQAGPADLRDLNGRTVVRAVVVRGTRVWLPGPALDSLAADLRRAAGVLDVTLTIPDSSRGDNGLVVSCGGRRVGDNGGVGGELCDVRGLYLGKYVRAD